MRELNTLRKTVNQQYPSGKLTFLGVSGCEAGKPEQQWNLTYSTADPSMAQVKSVLDGGCWEIPGCGGSAIDTDFGCKGLPKPGTSGCPANMAWKIDTKAGTITSLAQGNCLTLDAGGSKLTVTKCTPGSAAQKWLVSPSTGDGVATIKPAGGQGRCVSVRTTPDYNDPTAAPLSRPGGFAYPGTMVVGDGSMTYEENQVHFGCE